MKIEFDYINRGVGSCRLSVFDQNGIYHSVIAAVTRPQQRRSPGSEWIVCHHSFSDCAPDNGFRRSVPISEERRISRFLESMMTFLLSQVFNTSELTTGQPKFIVTVQHCHNGQSSDATKSRNQIPIGICMSLALNAVYFAIIDSTLAANFGFVAGSAIKNGLTTVAVFKIDRRGKLADIPVCTTAFSTELEICHDFGVDDFMSSVKVCREKAEKMKKVVMESIDKSTPPPLDMREFALKVKQAWPQTNRS